MAHLAIEKNGETWYQYARVRKDGIAQLVEFLESDKDQEIYAYSGAPNEMRYVEIDDSVGIQETQFYTLDSSDEYHWVLSLDSKKKNDILMDRIRKCRNEKLDKTEWRQNSDNTMSADDRQAWLTYRQALRDLPNQIGFDPENFTWPEEP